MRHPLTWMLVYSPTPELMLDQRILNFGMRIGDFDAVERSRFHRCAGAASAIAGFHLTICSCRKCEAEPPACPAHVADVFVACEQSLDPDNRVSVTPERDRFRAAESATRLALVRA